MIRIDELNERYDFLIDTIKREELYEFINSTAQIALFLKNNDENKKRDKGIMNKDEDNAGFGIAIGFIIFGVSVVVYELFSSLTLGLVVGIIFQIGTIIYLYIRGKRYTAMGLNVLTAMEIFLFIFCLYAWAMAGFPSLQ
jgi:hypothetical protein